jgi:DHA2 family multidrug resistance protein
VVHELTTREPVVDLRVLRDRTFSSGTVIGAVLGAVLFSSVFLLPIYMQELLRFDAMQSGLALLPRSIAMLFTIPIVGQIYNRTSPRAVIAFGLFLGGLSCVQMSQFTLDTSRAQILLPQVVQGVGLACIFIPLSTVALAKIDRRKMSAATGLNNLIRQLGGSFGVAIFASLLGRFGTRAKVALASHVTLSDPVVYQRMAQMKAMFMSRGMDQAAAQAQAVKLLGMQVGGQAAMLSFERTFFILGLLFFASIPLVWLLDEGRSGAAAGAKAGGHEEHIAVEI